MARVPSGNIRKSGRCTTKDSMKGEQVLTAGLARTLHSAHSAGAGVGDR
jgi:hypothetical protein